VQEKTRSDTGVIVKSKGNKKAFLLRTKRSQTFSFSAVAEASTERKSEGERIALDALSLWKLTEEKKAQIIKQQGGDMEERGWAPSMQLLSTVGATNKVFLDSANERNAKETLMERGKGIDKPLSKDGDQSPMDQNE